MSILGTQLHIGLFLRKKNFDQPPTFRIVVHFLTSTSTLRLQVSPEEEPKAWAWGWNSRAAKSEELEVAPMAEPKRDGFPTPSPLERIDITWKRPDKLRQYKE